MIYEQWDVVTALFPFTEAPVRKPRPLVVLSGASFNRAHGHIIGCMITTGGASHWPTDHAIANLASTGLSHRSLVRWKVFTLPFELLGRRIGALAGPDQARLAAIRAAILL